MREAVLLGLLQGLTEFLPVSSSGHLVVVPYLLSWPQPTLAFDVALHAGTLLAVLVYFSADIGYLVTRTLGFGGEPQEVALARRTVGLLVIGSIPAGVAGLLFGARIEDAVTDPRVAAGAFLVTAAILFGAEHLRRRRLQAELGADADLTVDRGRDERSLTVRDAVVVGAAQALALVPGISRSGATIAAGMVRGLSRSAATRFSFLLAIPAIAGATLVQWGDLTSQAAAGGAYAGGEIIAGVIAAAVAGYWAIGFLLELVRRDDLIGFARYVATLGVLTFIGYLWLGPPSTI